MNAYRCLLVLWFSQDAKVTNSEKLLFIPLHSDISRVTDAWQTALKELLQVTAAKFTPIDWPADPNTTRHLACLVSFGFRPGS